MKNLVYLNYHLNINKSNMKTTLFNDPTEVKTAQLKKELRRSNFILGSAIFFAISIIGLMLYLVIVNPFGTF